MPKRTRRSKKPVDENHPLAVRAQLKAATTLGERHKIREQSKRKWAENFENKPLEGATGLDIETSPNTPTAASPGDTSAASKKQATATEQMNGSGGLSDMIPVSRTAASRTQIASSVEASSDDEERCSLAVSSPRPTVEVQGLDVTSSAMLWSPSPGPHSPHSPTESSPPPPTRRQVRGLSVASSAVSWSSSPEPQLPVRHENPRPADEDTMAGGADGNEEIVNEEPVVHGVDLSEDNEEDEESDEESDEEEDDDADDGEPDRLTLQQLRVILGDYGLSICRGSSTNTFSYDDEDIGHPAAIQHKRCERKHEGLVMLARLERATAHHFKFVDSSAVKRQGSNETYYTKTKSNGQKESELSKDLLAFLDRVVKDWKEARKENPSLPRPRITAWSPTS